MKSVIALFPDYNAAEEAIDRLSSKQFQRAQISVVTQKRVMLFHLAEYDVLATSDGGWGQIRGAALGSLTGLLAGLGATAVPGLGAILATGQLATAVDAADAGLVGPLIALGIPLRLARTYRDSIKNGQILVAVQGEHRTDEARRTLQTCGAGSLHVFNLDMAVLQEMATRVRKSTSGWLPGSAGTAPPTASSGN